jgi:hypothetical protein
MLQPVCGYPRTNDQAPCPYYQQKIEPNNIAMSVRASRVKLQKPDDGSLLTLNRQNP